MKKFLLGLIVGALVSATLPALAANQNQNANQAANRTTEKNRLAAFDGSCMAAAVDKRDTAIVTAVATYSGAVTSALNARKDALKAAWAKTDRAERRAAIKSAWKTYRDALAKARSAFRTAKGNAWKQYQKDGKTCVAKTPTARTDDTTSSGVDAGL